jgi:2-polyprenyl-3-methyl-5-hydroxy-6-metoxy-1,4-benzoquinol methylase
MLNYSGEAGNGKNCAICGRSDLEVFLELSGVPAHCNVLWPSRNEAIYCSRGPIQLAFCETCGSIVNLRFDPSRIEYGSNYENSLHFSSSFSHYAQSLARDLIERHELREKVILEIGCGAGEFLSLLCRLGNNRGIGFDSAYVDGRTDTGAGRGITFFKNIDWETYTDPIDLVCCRQVLEHVSNPIRFMRGIRDALSKRPGAMAFFEVPNGLFTFEKTGMWDIIYPHCFYYSAASLLTLFSLSGLRVTRLEEGFGGQYLCVEATLSSRPAGADVEIGIGVPPLKDAIVNFQRNYQERVEEIRKALKPLGASKGAIVWGASAKAVMFLNKFRAEQVCDYVVDINPHKQGKFIPGTGQEIVPPEFLKEYRPEAVIVMNPNYREEIELQVERLGLQPKFMLM